MARLHKTKEFARIIELPMTQMLLFVQEIVAEEGATEPGYDEDMHLLTLMFNYEGQRLVVTQAFKGLGHKEACYAALKKASIVGMLGIYTKTIKHFRDQLAAERQKQMAVVPKEDKNDASNAS